MTQATGLGPFDVHELLEKDGGRQRGVGSRALPGGNSLPEGEGGPWGASSASSSSARWKCAYNEGWRTQAIPFGLNTTK